MAIGTPGAVPVPSLRPLKIILSTPDWFSHVVGILCPDECHRSDNNPFGRYQQRLVHTLGLLDPELLSPWSNHGQSHVPPTPCSIHKCVPTSHPWQMLTLTIPCDFPWWWGRQWITNEHWVAITTYDWGGESPGIKPPAFCYFLIELSGPGQDLCEMVRAIIDGKPLLQEPCCWIPLKVQFEWEWDWSSLRRALTMLERNWSEPQKWQ